MIERRRELIEECLRKKFKGDIRIDWWNGHDGNQIIVLRIYPYNFNIKVEIDRMFFFGNCIDANVDFILYYVRRSVLDNILY